MSDPTPEERARALYKTTTCGYECKCHMVVFPHEGEVATTIRDAVAAEYARLAACYVALARAAADAGMEHSALEFAAHAFCAPGDERPAVVILREAGDRLAHVLAQFNETDPLACVIRVAFAEEEELARLDALPPPVADAAADAAAREVFEATQPLREAALAHVLATTAASPAITPETSAAALFPVEPTIGGWVVRITPDRHLYEMSEALARNTVATLAARVSQAIRDAVRGERRESAAVAQAAADEHAAAIKENAASLSWNARQPGFDATVARQAEAQEFDALVVRQDEAQEIADAILARRAT